MLSRCNDCAAHARQAQELSGQLFLAKHLERTGPVQAPALVFEVWEEGFAVHVPSHALEWRFLTADWVECTAREWNGIRQCLLFKRARAKNGGDDGSSGGEAPQDVEIGLMSRVWVEVAAWTAHVPVKPVVRLVSLMVPPDRTSCARVDKVAPGVAGAGGTGETGGTAASPAKAGHPAEAAGGTA